MTSCPGCGFLMGDHERVCSSCAADEVAEHAPRVGSGSGAAAPVVAPVPTTTAVLDRPAPTAPPMPEHVEYRGRRRVGGRSLIVAVLVVGLVATGAVLGLDGRGPLAPAMVSAGLAEPAAVRIPSSWVEVTSDGGRFSADLPLSARPLGDELVGYTAPVGDGAALTVFSTDFDLGPAGMASYRSAGGLEELVDRFAAMIGLGDEIVRRDVRTAEGWAVDAVYVTNGDTTTRARFQLARDRFFAITTSGPDAAMTELDAAHAALLSSFTLR